jgi:hypothetical protein
MSMTAEKASTLKLLKDGMGKTIEVIESRGGFDSHEVRANLKDFTEACRLPVLFLLTTLAFLEAQVSDEGSELDGWLPADLISHLRIEPELIKVSLDEIRGRKIQTEIQLSFSGELFIRTNGRGLSANRWLSYVRGRSYLQDASLPRENA